jgi:protein ImuA
MNARPEILRSLREQLLVAGGGASQRRAGVSTALPVFDAFASVRGDGLASGAIHEVLADQAAGSIEVFATLVASSCLAAKTGGWIVWSDPHRTLYPPALVRAGVTLERLMILRPRSPQEELWAVAEAMRCAGVAATVAHVGKLTPVQARRLQLAAEQGGGVGVLVRPDDARAANYAAATRWRVTACGATSRKAQRWNVELVYGHGGRVGQTFVLEVDRETGRAVAAAAAVSDGGAAVAQADDPVRRAPNVANGSGATTATTLRSSA